MRVRWLLDPTYAEQMMQAFRSRQLPTAADAAAFDERMAARSNEAPAGYVVAGNRARLNVVGVLTNEPSFFLQWFGIPNTAYKDLIRGVSMAAADPQVKDIELYSDSPGGEVNGLFDALESLHTSSKSIARARARNAHSAAYGLVSSAAKIEAESVASSFGSVGVVATYRFFDFIEEIHVTSANAPDKRPDVRTEEGRATVERELNELEDLFITAIAKGRNASADDVRANFGKGASFLAKEAKRRGMIDSFPRSVLLSATRKVADRDDVIELIDDEEETEMADKNDPKTMSFAEFQLVNPAAAQAGIDLGRTAERKRVCSLLDLGETKAGSKLVGAHAAAAAEIRAGSDADVVAYAKIDQAQINLVNEAARQVSTDRVGQVVDGAVDPDAAGSASFVAALHRQVSKGDASGDMAVYLGAGHNEAPAGAAN